MKAKVLGFLPKDTMHATSREFNTTVHIREKQVTSEHRLALEIEFEDVETGEIVQVLSPAAQHIKFKEEK